MTSILYFIKTKLMQFVKVFIMMVLSYFAPVWAVMLAVGLSIGIDTLMGIIFAIKEGNFSSSKLKKGIVPKMLLYQLVVITMFLLDSLILMEFSVFFHNMPYLITKLTALTLISIEMISMFENFEKLFNIKIIHTIKSIFKFASEIKNNVNDLKK